MTGRRYSGHGRHGRWPEAYREHSEPAVVRGVAQLQMHGMSQAQVTALGTTQTCVVQVLALDELPEIIMPSPCRALLSAEAPEFVPALRMADLDDAGSETTPDPPCSVTCQSPEPFPTSTKIDRALRMACSTKVPESPTSGASSELDPTEPEGEFEPEGAERDTGVFTAVLEDLCARTLAAKVKHVLSLVMSPPDMARLARALYDKAVSLPGTDSASTPGLVADLVVALLPRPPLHGHLLLDALVDECTANFVDIEGCEPSETAHGCVLFLGELYTRRLVPVTMVKGLFMQLLFKDTWPLDHAVHLACHVLLVVGPDLDRSEVGSQMVELVVLRLKELKGGKYTDPTRFSMAEVSTLRADKWYVRPKRVKKEKEG